MTIFHTYDLTCGFGGAAIFEGAASWVLMIALPLPALFHDLKLMVAEHVSICVGLT